MLTVTDKVAIDAAFAAKTPRPFREVMLEIYPDATEDRNGRFHAPHDGYECPITGQVFRAGEFLPMEENEDAIGAAMMFNAKRKVPGGVDAVTGERYEWAGGTRAQNREVWSLLIEQSKAFDAANSAHLGEVGAKIELHLVISHIHAYEGFYGLQFIHIMKSGKDVVIYKGAKKLAEKGSKVTLEAFVKEHGVRDDVKQTVIQRPKAPKKPKTEREVLYDAIQLKLKKGKMTKEEAGEAFRAFDEKARG